ncbi:MAG TPA: hypothetical protein VHL11_13670, partial [Phototrophicaceae bacterium]|nr:hypothetical protein [Phototrophicaceae bacterium]
MKPAIQRNLFNKLPQLLFLSLVAGIVSVILFTRQQNLSSQQNEPTATKVPPTYDPESTAEIPNDLLERCSPAHFGIPDTIGGYKVIAVLSSENSACIPAGIIQLEVQTTEPDVDSYLGGDSPKNITEAIHALGIPNVTVSVSGPGGNLETIIRGNERWNAAMRAQGGCIKLGPMPKPILTNTPQPGIPSDISSSTPVAISLPTFDPEATVEITDELLERYSPAHFGVPDTIDGYKVLAVIASENTECRTDETIEAVIQIPQTMEEYLASNIANEIENAIKALGIPSLTFSITGTVGSLETLIRENERWNQMRQTTGCVRTGVPIIANFE